MQTRTRNAIGLTVIATAAIAGLVLLSGARPVPDLRPRALDAVPSGALLVATFDLAALRASPVGAPLLKEGREIPGLGKVSDVCGFDPWATLREVAVAVPAAGEAGDFGLSAAGDVDAEAVLDCAAKVIEARGGQPMVTPLGSFRAVRDVSLSAPGGEIAVRSGGFILLGAGPYLRAMIDAADRRAPTVRSSVAHAALGKDLGDVAVRVTVVLTPDQRATLLEELSSEGAIASPAKSIVAGAVGLSVGSSVGLHGVIACTEPSPCAELAGSLRRAKDERAADMATRLIGIGEVLEKLSVTADGDRVHAKVDVPADQAKTLIERVLTLRSFRHPMPGDRGPPGDPPAPPAPLPDAVIEPGRPPSPPAPSKGGTPQSRKSSQIHPAAPTTTPRP